MIVFLRILAAADDPDDGVACQPRADHHRRRSGVHLRRLRGHPRVPTLIVRRRPHHCTKSLFTSQNPLSYCCYCSRTQSFTAERIAYALALALIVHLPPNRNAKRLGPRRHSGKFVRRIRNQLLYRCQNKDAWCATESATITNLSLALSAAQLTQVVWRKRGKTL